VTAVAGVLGAVALAGMVWQASPRAAQPLGNALVLGEVLAALTPLALVAALDERGRRRAVAVGAAALAAAAMLATLSLSSLAGGLVGSALALPRGRRRWLLLPVLAGLVLLGPRLVRLAAGDDLSLRARAVYWQAGARGVALRPWRGWGPGATAWTLAPLLRPVPGVNPPGEVVGDLHGLVAQVPYELGIPGAAIALAVIVAFVRARRAEPLVDAAASSVRRGGLAGLGGGLASLAAGPTLGATAPWVALAVAAGAALAAGEGAGVAARATTAAGSNPAPTASVVRGAAGAAGWLYAAVALLLLVPLDAAQLCYDAARRAPAHRAAALMRLAAELDPDFPLYRARLGWLAGTATARALELQRAAGAAPGVPALQLAAGWASQVAGRPGAVGLLEGACSGDPLSGPAPFLLASGDPAAPAAPRLAARALLADPTLLAAVAWEEHPRLLGAALPQVAGWRGVDAGLRESVLDFGSVLMVSGPVALLRITMDEQLATALSLHAFRRLPWPATLVTVLVRRRRAEAIDPQLLPAASVLPSTAAGAFPHRCDGAPSGGR
jgi:hypothetical protein